MSFLRISFRPVRISCKHGPVGHATFDFRKQRRVPIIRVCLAERKPSDSTFGSPANEKPRTVRRPQKPTVWQAAKQVERYSPSAGQSAVAPKPLVRQAHRQGEQRGPSAGQSASSPKRFASQAHHQTLSVHGLRHPSHITAYTKQEKLVAVSLARRGRPEAALTGFCGSMDALFSVAGSQMNHINLAAIVTALAHVWEAAKCNDRLGSHAGVREGLEALYQRCVTMLQLQLLVADMAPQQLSTVLWSSAKLGLNPDAVVPGMAQDLALRVVSLIDNPEEKQRPNAQNVANVLWALATIGHPVPTEVLDLVCWHFASLA